jgi:MFS transporter, DHA2 family, multidrug resistance protein
MATQIMGVPPATGRTVNPWLIAATVPLAAFMELLDTTIVNVAIEHIAGSLSSSIDEATYVVTSYLIANVIVLPLSGYLAALMGRKNYYLWSVLVFTVASALCGFAPSLGALVFFRVLQGIGGGGMQPISQAILMDAFPREKHGTAQTLFAFTLTVAPMLGPVLGGWLTDNYSWRWIFLVNVPIGVLAFVTNARLVQDPPHLTRISLKEKRFDSRGLTLLAVGLGCLQFVLDRGQIDDWFGSNLITAFTLISIVALAVFVWWELREKDPVVDLRLLGNVNFSLSVLTMFMMGFVFYAANYMQPLFCQQMMDWTATWAGLGLSPSGVAFVAMMPIMPRLLKWLTPRYMVVIGFMIHGLACLVMVGWNLDMPFWKILGTRTFQTFGLTWLVVPINVMAFGFLTKDKTTNGSGLLSLARNFGTSCGVSLSATLLARRAQAHQGVLISHLTSADETYRSTLTHGAQLLFHHGHSLADSGAASVALIGQTLQHQAALLSYIDSFWVLVICSFVIAPIPLLIRKPKPQGSVSEQATATKMSLPNICNAEPVECLPESL